MSEPLASFSDLKGIGPATEARLHEAGVYSWQALGAVAAALAAVRRNDDHTLREVAGIVAARREEAGSHDAPLPPSAERLESFVVRLALSADGEPQRCSATSVRTMAEQSWARWTPAELVRFVENESGLSSSYESRPRVADGPVDARSTPARETTPAGMRSRTHAVVVDAGKAIGGASDDIDLMVTSAGGPRADFDYRATLSTRPLGTADDGDDWTARASQTGVGHPAGELALHFADVRLPPGIHRLQLSFDVSLPAPAGKAPELALASLAERPRIER